MLYRIRVVPPILIRIPVAIHRLHAVILRLLRVAHAAIHPVEAVPPVLPAAVTAEVAADVGNYDWYLTLKRHSL